MTARLTGAEIQQLRERAAGDMRSIGGTRTFLVVRHLSGRGNGRRRKAVASPSDKRVSYEFAVPVTVEQKAQLQARATAQTRSVPSYVAKLIVEDLAKN